METDTVATPEVKKIKLGDIPKIKWLFSPVKGSVYVVLHHADTLKPVNKFVKQFHDSQTELAHSNAISRCDQDGKRIAVVFDYKGEATDIYHKGEKIV